MKKEITSGLSSEKSFGREQTVKLVVHKEHGYAFNDTNANWSIMPEYNAAFLRSNMQYLHHLYHSRGYLFLNEVLDAFGFARCGQGQIAGWHKHGDVLGMGDIRYDIVDLKDKPGETGIWVTIKPSGIIVDRIDQY